MIDWTVVTRLALAGFLAGLVGIERETHGRSAGLRTNVLVGMGSALFMILSSQLNSLYPTLDSHSILRLDPGRIASYAVAGMGFMGAGVILKGKGDIRGVTTAACLWVNTGVGLAVGCGMWLPAVVLTTFTLFTLICLKYIDMQLHRDLYSILEIQSEDLPGQLDAVLKVISERDGSVLFVEYDQNLRNRTVEYSISLKMKRQGPWREIAAEISALPGLNRVCWRSGRV